ncbi:dihydroorotase [Thiothrix caldifontis]|jgi:Dihydroorotase and related cyclic amidohydrolases|uniref:Dihydroorotase n=1 Tax=Thiothrix caldifontis TaxID=525918 RepID=A0A1H4CSC7_9GAMM|nr:dihydroorotase [Thiothrix caldifontis]SEA63333.1 dihydroorotase [Thiothrix caldifontis]
MSSLLIVNANVVNEGQIFEADVLVRNGRIEAIGQQLSAPDIEVLDAAGRYLMPGMIDDQVHFREPGMTHKADMATESRAAVAGGITSFMDMPNTVPNTLTSAILNEKKQLAAGRSVGNYAFYLGASNDNLEAIKALNPKDACGIKVFMGASTGNMLVDDPEVLEQIFTHAPTLIAAHCEDTPTIMENEESYRSIYGDNIPFSLHPIIRSEAACYKSSSMAMELAKRCGTRLHILHISTAKEAEMFADLDLKDKRITAEACVHFLHFADEDYASKGALIKCNPAIKTAEDRAGIIQALLDGRLDVIGTDHAPHTWEEKHNPSYFKTPSGLPLVQHALPLVLEHYQDGIFTLEFIVEKTSHAVAEMFNIKERGYIREGYWADLVLVDLEQPFTSTHANSLSKCGWTPFDGYEFRSSITATLVNGQLVWKDGKLLDVVPKGMALEFDR